MRKTQVKVLSIVMPYSAAVEYNHFRRPCCLHLHFTLKMEAAIPQHYIRVTIQKTSTWIFSPIKATNLAQWVRLAVLLCFLIWTMYPKYPKNKDYTFLTEQMVGWRQGAQLFSVLLFYVWIYTEAWQNVQERIYHSKLWTLWENITQSQLESTHQCI